MTSLIKPIVITVACLLITSATAFAGQPFFEPSKFSQDLLEQRRLFLAYDLPEAKDICKQFLTLVVAVLVFTLTFSEKIINFNNATRLVKNILIASWVSFILSIILCGVGIGELLMAAGKAVYFDRTFRHNEQWAIYLIILSGITFVLGLGLIIIDAVICFRKKRDLATDPVIV